MSEYERIVEHQRRCVECWSISYLAMHHRIFRSKTNHYLQRFLEEKKIEYEESYRKELILWWMNDRQNLVRLCRSCHEKVHNGFKDLRWKYENSFTCPITGYNIPYKKG